MSRRVRGRGSSARLRVLFIDNSYTFGGAIIGLARLVRGLEDLGVESFVVSGQPPEVMRELFGDHGTRTLRVETSRTSRTMLQRFVRERVSDRGMLSRMAHELSNVDSLLRRDVPSAVRYGWFGFRNDVDLVHLNNGLYCQVDGFLASRLLRIPCICHTRGFHEAGRFLNATAGRVDRHIAISRAIEQNLLDVGAPPEKVTLVHDAVDFATFAAPCDTRALRRELGIPERAKTFGFLGRLITWKGVREFVSAAIRVLRRQPEAYALVVGDESDGDRSYFREVQQMARRSMVGDRIVFTGYREDVAALLHMMDVMVHTSLRPEPFGLVIVEAMATGTPVIAADQGGPLDVVVDGETGFLVDPQDEKALVQSIERILTDPSLAQRLGEAGKRRARDVFGVERHARKVAEVYEEVTRA